MFGSGGIRNAMAKANFFGVNQNSAVMPLSPRWPDYITSPSVACQARKLQLPLRFLSQKEKI